MDADILRMNVSAYDHTDTTSRTSGQSDLDFINAAVAALNVTGLDVVTVALGEHANIGGTPDVLTYVVCKRQSRQNDTSFKGDVSSAIKTAAGL